MKQKGFTLVELLISTFIIGILISAVIVFMSDATQKARDGRRINDIEVFKTGQEYYQNDNDSLSESMTGLLKYIEDGGLYAPETDDSELENSKSAYFGLSGKHITTEEELFVAASCGMREGNSVAIGYDNKIDGRGAYVKTIGDVGVVLVFCQDPHYEIYSASFDPNDQVFISDVCPECEDVAPIPSPTPSPTPDPLDDSIIYMGENGIDSVNYTGSDNDQVIYGTDDAGNTIDGGGGNDFIYGYMGNDILFGGDGDDFLTGGNGNDKINGGNGTDTVIYTGEFADYSFIAGTKAKDNRVQRPDGIDFVYDDVEFLQFSDITVAYDDIF